MKNNYLTMSSRILVGALFIVSGLIKANDTIGFSYKLEEYFASDALNWPIFQGWEVGLSMLICVAEILLGVAVLAGERFILAVWSLLLMIVFFTFLTGYTAIGNWFFENPDKGLTQWFANLLSFEPRKIHYFKDCGCFGDALPLTPWQSFLKDIVLLVLIVILFINRKFVRPNSMKDNYTFYGISLLLIALFAGGVMGWYFPIFFTLMVFAAMHLMRMKLDGLAARGWYMAIATTLISSIFTWYTYAHLPVKDFRPFAIGKNIVEGMEMPEGKEPPQYKVIYTMQNEKTGEVIQVSSIDYLEKEVWKNQDLKIIETSESILHKAGYVPPIHDFVLESIIDGDDYTYSILSEPRVLFWVMYDLGSADESAFEAMSKLSKLAQENNIQVYGLTASMFDEVDVIKGKYSLFFDFYTCDATTLKTVIRSNPGCVLVSNGTVLGKWHAKDIPSIDKLNQLLK